MTRAKERRRLRFGPFELDAQGPRLTEDGRSVKVQPQPLRVLAVLVEHAGDVVTRDDLRRQVWDQATFVEFDQGLNYCVRQIRIALRDDAANPIYLETVKGQGYRFVAAVTGDEEPAAAAEEPPAVMPPTATLSRAPRQGWTRAALIAGALVVVTALGAWAYAHGTRAPHTAAGAALQPLTDFADSALAPALSPDGRMVAFIRGNSWFLTPDQIYVKVLPDGEARQLTHDPRLKYGPTFSPDGSLVAYTVMENPGWSTYVVPVLGGEPQRLLANAAGLTWLDAHQLLFAEIRGGQHMGFVTSSPARDDMREVYFPVHERAMAHYAYPSPDRRTALIVEMDANGKFVPCRLVTIDGSAPSRQVGPAGTCVSAGWSPDGRWMYFSGAPSGRMHLWRQPIDDPTPEPLTQGATDELGLAVAADGRSLVTSAGVSESTLWLHDPTRERQLSFEGHVGAVGGLSADGRTVYYILQRDSAGQRELHRRSLVGDQDDIVLPNVPIHEFDISPDGARIVYSTETATGSTQLWVAPLDQRVAAQPIGVTGEHAPHFGPGGEIVALVIDGHANYLQRWRTDGSGWTKVVPYPISLVQSFSPARRWATVIAPLLDNSTAAAMAVPLAGGPPIRICENYCQMNWASDGRTLYASVEEPSLTAPGRALAIPVGPNETLPALPAQGVGPGTASREIPGARFVPHATLLSGPDPDTYVYVRTVLHRNLFRLILPGS